MKWQDELKRAVWNWADVATLIVGLAAMGLAFALYACGCGGETDTRVSPDHVTDSGTQGGATVDAEAGERCVSGDVRCFGGSSGNSFVCQQGQWQAMTAAEFQEFCPSEKDAGLPLDAASESEPGVPDGGNGETGTGDDAACVDGETSCTDAGKPLICVGGQWQMPTWLTCADGGT